MDREAIARARYQEILDSLEKLEATAIAAALQELDRLRIQVDRTFVDTDWQAHRGKQLVQAIDRATAEYQQAMTGTLAGAQQAAWDQGLTLAQAATPPEYQAGIAWAHLGRPQFEMWRQNSLFFITDLAADLRRSLSREVLLATTGLRTPTEAMQVVKDWLGDGRKAANRAQAIVRTEIGRNFSMATQVGLEESAAYVPDLQKMWLHAPAGTSKTVRPAHVVMSGKSVPWNGLFHFPGGALRFPQDPNGPPNETVNCKCRVIPWRRTWEKT